MRSLAMQQYVLAVRQRVDLSGQLAQYGSAVNARANITDKEIAFYVQGSIAKVWDILILKYGDNYAYGLFTWVPTPGVYTYELPYDYYKEVGVDLALDDTLQNWATVRPYTERERNLFSFPLQTVLAYAGWQNIRYQIQGNNINILPQTGPVPGHMRIRYCQACPRLVNSIPGAYPANGAVTVGDLCTANITDSQGLVTAQVFAALNTGTAGASAPAWVVPGVVTDSGGVIWGYQGPLSLYVTVFDAISGYEELVILDASIKCRVKQEKDVSGLMAQFAAETERITSSSANRQSGDVMTIMGGWGMAEGGPAYGSGFGPFGDST